MLRACPVTLSARWQAGAPARGSPAAVTPVSLQVQETADKLATSQPASPAGLAMQLRAMGNFGSDAMDSVNSVASLGARRALGEPPRIHLPGGGLAPGRRRCCKVFEALPGS